MAINIITDSNFDEVKNTDKKVLLDFYADWCGPCRMVSPFVDQIADEHPEFFVGKINVDENPVLSAEFQVSSIPMLVVMQNGVVTKKSLGAIPKAQILALLED